MEMSTYLSKVKKLQYEFEELSIVQLPRKKNSDADVLANLGSSIVSKYRQTILVEILTQPNIMEVENKCSVEKMDKTWIIPIFSYIQNRILPIDKFEVRRV